MPLQRAPAAAGQGPALQEGTHTGLCPTSSHPGEPSLAVPLTQGQLGPARSGAGPPPARPAHGFGSVCSLRIKLCWPGGPCRLVPVAFGTCHSSGWSQSPWGQLGAGPVTGCHCRDHQGLLHCTGSGPWGSKVQGHDDTTEARGEVAGWSHGFLMVQIEVSLLPLCVGRSHQAGGESANTDPAAPAASCWAGS